jgi:hypothetical protein
MKKTINDLAKEHAADWKVYAKIEVDTPPTTLPGDTPPPGPYYNWVEVNAAKPIEPDKIVELMINARVDNGQSPSAANNKKGGERCIIQITPDGATSNLDNEKAREIIDIKSPVASNTRK